jgi:hypothetical protein
MENTGEQGYQIQNIEVADGVEELMVNPGAFKAIEYAFRCRCFPIDRNSREYAEIARAYWMLVFRFDPDWREKQGKPYPCCASSCSASQTVADTGCNDRTSSTAP